LISSFDFRISNFLFHLELPISHPVKKTSTATIT